MRRRITLVTITALLVMAPAADAAVLFTHATESLGTNTFQCWITNVSSRQRSATVDILSEAGAVVQSFTFALDPLTSRAVNAGSTARVCRFTVDAKTNFRAGACSTNATGCITNVPAR